MKKPGPDGTFENLAYRIIDNEADLEKKWPDIMAESPDFIKVHLLYSEELQLESLRQPDAFENVVRNHRRNDLPKTENRTLSPGYEASFLVLGGNPIDNFENVKDIRMRFKQGSVLTSQLGTSSGAP